MRSIRYPTGVIFFCLLLLISCTARRDHQASQPAAEHPTGSININTATADELERLPHIGRKTAEAIVRFREENGPFQRIEYLMQVRGISEKRFIELRPMLTIQ